MSSINYSTNGISWSNALYTAKSINNNSNYARSLLEDSEIIGIAQSGEIWAAGLSSGALLRSKQSDYDPKTFEIIHNREGIDWTTTITNFGSSVVEAVDFGNNLWVAVSRGTSLHVRSSTDAVSWTTIANNSVNTLKTVAYGNGLWLIGGYYGSARASTDLVTWTTVNVQFQTSRISEIAYGNGQWVAVGYGGKASSSTDGLSWSTRTINYSASTLYAVEYGNGIWVAGGGVNAGLPVFRTSTDAVSWQTVTFTNATTSSVRSIVYSDERKQYAALRSSGEVLFSTNGINWTSEQIWGTTYGGKEIDYGDGVWRVSMGQNLYSSQDGITWTSRVQVSSSITAGPAKYRQDKWVTLSGSGWARVSQDSPLFASGLKGFYLHRNNRFLALEKNNMLHTSGNAINFSPMYAIGWTTKNSSFGSSSLFNVANNGSTWVIGGNGGKISRSTDNGNTFSSVTSPFATTGSVNEVAYGNGVWVAAGAFGAWSRSIDDGATWSANGYFFTSAIVALGYFNGIWLMGSTGGRLASSTDGLTWTTRNSTFGNTTIYSVAYGQGIWAIAGATGQIRTSTDTVTWVTQTSTMGTTFIWSIAYGNGLWVIGGSAGQIRASTDAVTWVTRNSIHQNIINKVTYGNGMWVAAGYRGGIGGTPFVNQATISKSTDTVTWVTMISNSINHLSSLAYANGKWLATGYSGTLIEMLDDNLQTDPNKDINAYFSNGTDTILLGRSYIFVENGQNGWVPRNVGINDNFNHISWVTSSRGSMWLMSGNNAVYSSTDLVSWTTRSVPISGSSITDIISSSD